jgi:hypothetical protein
MQTFLPFRSFTRCASVIDDRRCGKQRVEAWQIYQTLMGRSEAWKNHPIVKMWAGYEKALAVYYNTFLEEWACRGFQNIKLKPIRIRGEVEMPPWIGSRKFHDSHRSNLVRKLPKHYRRYFPRISDSLPYFWPVPERNISRTTKNVA